MNNSTNDEIFYSDDESSDGESTVQVKFQPKNIANIQGDLFNWPPPKNHKFKKK